jgi:hypothetical protein
MLCSYSIENEKMNIFSIFLVNIINGNSLYKEEVNKVIKEVKELSLGEKTIFSIDRSYFNIIQYLYESNPDFFKNIDLQSIRTSDYKFIEQTLLNKKEFILV